MSAALIITAYNRPQYLKRCLESIAKTDLSSIDTIMIVDDHSVDTQTLHLIDNFHVEGVEIIKMYSKENRSIKGSLLHGLDLLFGSHDVVLNLDGDAIVNSKFVNTLTQLHLRFQNHIITGFNCFTKNRDGSERHKVVSSGDGFTLRKSVGGINMLIGREQYQKWVRPALVKSLAKNLNWDDHTCRASMADGFEIIAASPSVIQHIGFESSMGHSTGGEPPDVADDFVDDTLVLDAETEKLKRAIQGQRSGKFIPMSQLTKLRLPNVTIVGADCVDVNRLIKAINISCSEIEFGDVVILSSLPSKDKRVVKIRHLATKGDYSTFMMKELVDYIKTDYLLVVQYDGYVVNASAWRNEWLKYDYIGAVWEWYKDSMRVGNGGFSLRSRRLHQVLKDDVDIIPINEAGVTKHMEEDHCICRLYYQLLKYRHKIGFASEEEARKFSIEAWSLKPPQNLYDGSFGFHGFSVDFNGANISHKPYLLPDKKLL